jgi:hypothetical protein
MWIEFDGAFMILSREFVDAINEFVGQWQAKAFTDVDSLTSAIENLHELADKESELDFVDINEAEADG